LDKCLISPIRCSEEEVATVQQVVFPCQVAPFCCKYLGTPLSLTRLRRSDEQHLVDAVSDLEDRPAQQHRPGNANQDHPLSHPSSHFHLLLSFGLGH
jgi:hypothetical protein